MKSVFRVLFSPLTQITLAQRILALSVLILSRPFISTERPENLRKAIEPVIFVFNHNSAFETVLIAAYLVFARCRNVRFVVDWVFGYLPLVGWIVRQAGPIFVYNKRARIGFMEPIRHRSLGEPVWRQINHALANRESVAIFPEGTRNDDPQFLKRGRSGIGRIAIDSRSPVIPIGIDFPRRIKSGRIPLFGRIIFRFGESVDLSEEIHAAEQLDSTGLTASEQKRVRQSIDKLAVHRIMLELARLSGKIYPFEKPTFPIDQFRHSLAGGTKL